jgi:hypothetical protein
MSKAPLFRFIASLALLITVGLGSALRPALAYSPATFTITSKSAYLRSAPSLAAPRVNSAFQGQTYDIIGRTADNAWVKLDFAGATGDTWALAALGAITGNLNSVPAVDSGAVPAPTQVPPAATLVPPAATSGVPNPVAPAAVTPAAQPVAIVAAPVTEGVGSLRFTITTKSAYLRSGPSWNAAKVGSAFQGQVFTAVGRSPDSQWVRLADGSWAGAGVGQLSGAIATLAAATAGGKPAASTTTTTTLPLPTGVPTITLHMIEIYADATKRGLNPLAFAMAGDCNSEPYIYLELAAANLINIPAYGSNLKETVGQFYPSLIRKSVAVRGSFSTAAMFDPQWADPKQCQSGEGVFACELRVTQASMVFIALGTGDHFGWRDFEANDRRLIQYALGRGVLPVLVTKADDLEATTADAPSGYINSVIRKLGAEYDVPVMDLNAATAGLYNHALQKDNFHLDEFGIKAHVLLTLQTLDALWRAK